MRADLDARANRYLAAGVVTADVVLLGPAGEQLRSSFLVEPERAFYLTVPGVARHRCAAVPARVRRVDARAAAPARTSAPQQLRRAWSSSARPWAVCSVVFGWLLSMHELATQTVVVAAVARRRDRRPAAMTATQAGRRARLKRVARKHEGVPRRVAGRGQSPEGQRLTHGPA